MRRDEAVRYAPQWADTAGRPNINALHALSLLDQVEADGLDPNDFARAALRRLAAGLEISASPTVSDVATFDVGMSRAALRYFRQLHLGRVSPLGVGLRTFTPREPHDFATVLRSALDHHAILDAASELAPRVAQYRGLRSWLVTYRSLAATWTATPPRALAVVHPDEPYADLRLLREWLVGLGDLPTDAPVPDASPFENGRGRTMRWAS